MTFHITFSESCIDIISKNFNGLYVLYEILNVTQKRKKTKKRVSKSDKLTKETLPKTNYFESLLS